MDLFAFYYVCYRSIRESQIKGSKIFPLKFTGIFSMGGGVLGVAANSLIGQVKLLRMGGGRKRRNELGVKQKLKRWDSLWPACLST